MANLPEDKKWTEVYQWETSDRALGGPDSQFTKPVRDLTARTGYLKEQVEKGNNALTAHEKSTNHPAATTAAKGFVQLSSAVDSSSEALASTPKAVKTAMDKANSATTAASTAQTTANTANSTANTAKTNAATAQSKADSAYSLASTANTTASSAKSTAETDATTSTKGRVQLSSAVDSTSEALAATPKAVKTAMDKANSAASAASAAQTTANTANSTANISKTNAATAQTKADSAYTLANTANTTANNANTNANGRVPSTRKVNNKALSADITLTAADVGASTLGIGQTWQNVKALRALNTTYTNTTNKPIFIAVTLSNTTNASWSQMITTIDGIEINTSSGGFDSWGSFKGSSIFLLIPISSTYKVTSSSSTILSWAELR